MGYRKKEKVGQKKSRLEREGKVTEKREGRE